MTTWSQLAFGLRTFASDIADGFFEITHNGFILIGLLVALAAVGLGSDSDLRQNSEIKLIGWLQDRQTRLFGGELDAIERATATNPKELPQQQADVAYWLSKKYRVAPEPLSALVAEAYKLGKRTQLDPTLILAVMAVESGFNPFAQSTVGAQGLMQVMTTVHTDKYQNFGGHFAAFDPVTNLRVGVHVLQECIVRAGSLEGGLRYYVGAANLPSDGGYARKVLAEHALLYQVANGFSLPVPVAALPTAKANARFKVKDKAKAKVRRPAPAARLQATLPLPILPVQVVPSSPSPVTGSEKIAVLN